MINIKRLNRAEVLKVLYDNAEVIADFERVKVPEGYVTIEHCKELLKGKREPYFDYMYGKRMKIRLKDDEIDETEYDRVYGKGMAKKAISNIKPMTSITACELFENIGFDIYPNNKNCYVDDKTIPECENCFMYVSKDAYGCYIKIYFCQIHKNVKIIGTKKNFDIKLTQSLVDTIKKQMEELGW